MIQSKHDQCRYQYLTLTNGLRVLLVEDSGSKKSAISATIAMGHFQDPTECEGLSHLLEHMLFLGCQKFNRPNHLADYLSSSGGHVNAWTGTEHSSFYFDTLTQALGPALEQFSAMLQQPNFSVTDIESEIHSIDAEFRLKQKDDLRCLYQVHKETCNHAHPFSKFSVGNSQVFSQFSASELQKMLRTMHSLHYHATNICLCVVSDLPLDQSSTLVKQYFEAIPQREKVPAQELPPLYLPEHLGLILKVVPIKTARRMIVTFALPDIQPYYRSKPLYLLSHLIGDEGQGSLLSHLKKQGLATNLSAGGGIHGSNFKDFNINLQLTVKGASQWSRVLTDIFAYLKLIKRKGISRWRFDERKQFNQLAFDFHDKPRSIELASGLSEQMHHYPQEHLLIGEYLMDSYEPELIQSILAQLNPDNMRLKLIMPELETDREARWYSTPYAVEKLSASLRQQLLDANIAPDMQLPEANPYLCVRTEPHQMDPAFSLPQQLISNTGFKFWFGQDPHFNQPKGELYLSFDSAAIEDSPELRCYKRIWTSMVQDKLNQQYYQAMIAGLNFHFYAHQGGFSLHTSGFSDRQFELAEQIVYDVMRFEFSDNQFEHARARQWQAMQNNLLNKPINRLFTRLSVLLQPLSDSPLDMLPILDTATPEKMRTMQYQLLKQLHLDAFAYGDWSEQQARTFSANISTALLAKAQPIASIPRRIVSLESAQRYLLPVRCQPGENAVLLYLQSPDRSVGGIARSILTEQLLSGPFFNQLRTEKQLGYVVGSGYMPYNQHPGIGFYIQSPTHSVENLVMHIDSFLLRATELIQSIPEQEWKGLKSSISKQLTASDTSLSMRSQRLWLAIGNQDRDFDQQHQLSTQIERLSLNEVVLFLEQLIKGGKPAQLLLYNQPGPNDDVQLKGEIISNMSKFKASAPLVS
ncbi:insulinase family protein [Lacimicrobium alkaliphilum]|uniref:Protease 3 n=1 Tax=Lacimicrobium alkaliphilum TaxID=1526571 RepID=A0ABQ1RPH5_9ALTE|nr:insulinase family protein [Lacimicrobium alkaliphilum]GGD75993.1 peptidase M16 [Lacimicrobium alkaliphilum]